MIVLDSSGYASYRDPHGRTLLPRDYFEVRLVTDIGKLGQAQGPELESVVGVRRNDWPAYADAAKFLYSVNERPAARLISLTERLMLPAARLREELGLPGMTIAETMPFRDKVLMKLRIRESGIRVPEFSPFSDVATHDLFKDHPILVAKPRLGAGSESIHTLRGRSDLEAFVATHGERLAEFEVEAYIDGPVFHVDGVVRQGKVIAATAGRYLDGTTGYETLAPCRDVAVAAGPLLDDLLSFNQRVIECYPEFTGVTHHEMFVTGDGICHCEIAARAGGGGVGAGFWSRTGVDLHEVSVQVQTIGSVPAAIEVAPHLTGWVIIYAGSGILQAPIQVPDDPWVIEARIMARPGDRLRAPASAADGVAIVSVSGDTEAEVISRLSSVIGVSHPKVAPIDV